MPPRRPSSSAEPTESNERRDQALPGPFLYGRSLVAPVYAGSMSTNDFYDRIVGLRAHRTYLERALTDEDLSRLLEAARWTGSSKNLQNWSFIVVDGDQRERLAECGSFTGPIRNATVVVALVEESGGNEFDTGRVAQNLMLAADALGIASCPITLHRTDEAAAVLGLPSGARCRYAVSFGYPAEDTAPRPPGGRKPMQEVAFHNRHGEAW